MNRWMSGTTRKGGGGKDGRGREDDYMVDVVMMAEEACSGRHYLYLLLETVWSVRIIKSWLIVFRM